jgi:HD-like signal output (HDOD) protein
MGIDRAILEGLEEKTQVFFLKQLNLLAAQRVEELAAREEKKAIRGRLLMDRISEIHQKMASYTRSPMFQGVIEKVPRLPAFAGSLLVRLADTQSSVRDVSDLVKQDPSLVGVVLKCINSPYFSLANKVSDIHQAVLLLGFNEVHRLIISEGVRRSMPDNSTFRNLHLHSLAISHIAFAVSLASRTGVPAQASTLGLIHDLGKSLIELVKKQNPSLGIMADLFDDAGLGAMLLKKWNLPESVWRSVEYQMHPEIFLPSEIPAEIRQNVAILYLAHLCLDLLQGKKIEPTRTIFFNEYAEILGWERLSIEKAAAEKIVPVIRSTPQPLPAFLSRLLRDF